ncbi:MAG TPA: sn-glycerol-3-phosphate ABC transporter ATP-binding protein UgpC [Acetobacteraceae bacterium]|jgi:multiple sugar transport system ATP-binding protein|nr:sn-glycerol-3-phosphate ABC transporter ATP-binding protein UgpC [Acetobacteraceae bacterium]
MASVTLEHVSKTFGDTTVVRDVSLEIRDKEFLVLVGPSGCGKSTILRMIAGLEDVSDGEIYIGDKLVNDVSAKDRDIAMVFQNYALYPHMSVFDNLAYGLRQRHTAAHDIRQRVHAVAERLGIEPLLLRKPKQLSGGQRQRAALGRAIVREPRVFLMDEPLSNLDAKLRVQTRVELAKLHARLQTTIIYVTHDQVEAMTLGNRIAILKDGVLQQVDSPAEVYARPANVFVAGFIGSPAMNFFDARLARVDGGVQVAGGGLQIDLPSEIVARTEGYSGRPVILGIRPEDIHDGSRAAPGGSPPSCANVDVVEHMGSENFVHLTSGDTTFVARLDRSVDPRPGETLPIVVDADRIRLFDPTTEEAIL